MIHQLSSVFGCLSRPLIRHKSPKILEEKPKNQNEEIDTTQNIVGLNYKYIGENDAKGEKGVIKSLISDIGVRNVFYNLSFVDENSNKIVHQNDENRDENFTKNGNLQTMNGSATIYKQVPIKEVKFPAKIQFNSQAQGKPKQIVKPIVTKNIVTQKETVDRLHSNAMDVSRR